MKLKYLNYIILLLAVFASCSEPIDITVEEKEKNIVLNSMITPDSLIVVHLSKSIGILEPDKAVEYLTTAEVELYEDDVFVENLQYDTDGYYISTIYPIIGKTYKLKAKYGDLKYVETTDIIPETVPIENIIYELNINSWVDQWYDYENEIYYDTTLYSIGDITVNTVFNDPADKENYYLLYFTTYLPVYDYPAPLYEEVFVGNQLSPISYSSSSLSYTSYYYGKTIQGFAISDEFFNGKTYNFTVSLDAWQFNNGNYYYDEHGNYFEQTNNLPQSAIYVNLMSISEGFYSYIISSNKYEDASSNPLAEPVNVYSNIENGFGLFTSYSCALDSIQIVYE